MKRSTYAGIGGLLASLGAAAIMPPDVVQEVTTLLFGVAISTKLAAWLGTVVSVTVAWASARLAPDQPEPQAHTDVSHQGEG